MILLKCSTYIADLWIGVILDDHANIKLLYLQNFMGRLFAWAEFQHESSPLVCRIIENNPQIAPKRPCHIILADHYFRDSNEVSYLY